MKTQIYLVMIDKDKDRVQTGALRFAAERAKIQQGRVALLYVVEPQSIEAWSGVEKALLDEAFAEARKEMAQYESLVKDISGMEPLTFYRKGERASALLELINSQNEITMLVMDAKDGDGARNSVLQYIMSDKGLKKLSIPCIVVPENMRDDAPSTNL